MRVIYFAILVSVSACGKGESVGAEEARKQSEAELEAKVAAGVPAKKISTPVPGSAKIPCSQLIDAAAYQTALGEKEPLGVEEVTSKEAEAAASCNLTRGGKPLTEADQKALLKKEGRLGVLPGDVLCNVTALCYTIESADRFRAKCKDLKRQEDESMGSFACIQVVAQGVDDVHVYRFFDEDTKCILQVRGGPSNVNNDLIRSCAKVARDSIGPAQIAVTAGGAAPPAKPAGSGS
ncbi:MAG: hypothetical protein H6Q90_2165 [Deltaproteobacteria bacterium]|nr:hypothetical protein [Deltaproteobacteria bacterium]